MAPAEDERPSKRARQACGPCRRKKSRCPGEKPVCSYCERLGQRCTYSGDEARSEEPENFKKMDERISGIESTLDRLMDYITRPPQDLTSSVPASHHEPELPPQDSPSVTRSSELSAADLYLTYCNSQPLLLFPYRSSVASLGPRDPELICAIEALGTRFYDGAVNNPQTQSEIKRLIGRASQMVMMRVVSGSVELSTLQTMCLLSMLEFTAGHIIRARFYTKMASYFMQNLKVNGLDSLSNLETERDERKLCFIGLNVLRNLQGSFQPLHPRESPDPLGENGEPSSLLGSMISNVDNARRTSSSKPDIGIVGTNIYTSELWALACNYAASPVGIHAHPPWSPHSDYAMIHFQHCEHESLMPLRFRLHASPFQDHPSAELQAHRDYWGPWLFFQMAQQLQQLRDSVSPGGLMTASGTLGGSNQRQMWSVNLQLLWKILVYAHASKSPDSGNDIFGPELAKDSVGSSGDHSVGDITERDFTLIGSAGISGHKTVAAECVTYPPEQTEDPVQLPSQIAPTMDLSGLPDDPNVEVTTGDGLYLQLQDYGRAFEDWLSVNPI
ncbi:hypothetical protein PENANT_c016G01833 [Penicillium antarcticum]|uniref:Zn(2)-C6 fungal-type domain-containing protein n=1 Tax=Penicillium antarcticum TaxID=416450 RepID=A0A1V6Q2J2_9EURO|nr:hypothetical protein PENANT_c016G01833 [Penicillium antarcticum]